MFIVSQSGDGEPRPNFAITLKHSPLHSRRAGIWNAVGVAVGNLVRVIFSLLGIAGVVSQSILLFNALKWFGATINANGFSSLVFRVDVDVPIRPTSAPVTDFRGNEGPR